MGRTKDLLYDGPFDNWKPELNDLPDDEWFFNPNLRHFDAEYEEWCNSEGYVSFVNDEIDIVKKKYSDGDIVDALNYASKSIIIEPSEVGKEVYERLFSEKLIEYLKKLNGTN